ncbi:MAG: hypothetical protein J7605_02480 [Variovorax sp.]|nr:hypothetical protein [Variovorax sp.]
MFAIDDPSAVAVMPTPEAAGTPGWWTEGNPALGQTATLMRASWFNALQQELLNILTAAGVTPSKTAYNQLLASLNLLYKPGRLLRKLIYTRVAGVQNVSVNGGSNTTTGAGTYVPGASMSFAIAKVQAGGGAGGGPSLPSAGNVTLGSPGGAGAYGESLILAATIGASQVVTVGLGGSKVVGGSGNAGGTSSLGSLLSCAGGIGGGLLANQVPPSVSGNGSNVVATGANLFQIKGTGSTATFSVTAAANGGLGGCGGNSIFGGGGPGAAGNGAGIDAVNFGAGGSGAVINNGFGGSTSGGAGMDGIVIIEEYA